MDREAQVPRPGQGEEVSAERDVDVHRPHAGQVDRDVPGVEERGHVGDGHLDDTAPSTQAWAVTVPAGASKTTEISGSLGGLMPASIRTVVTAMIPWPHMSR